jgi:hypothetical protein
MIPCSLVESYCFGGTWCLHLQGGRCILKTHISLKFSLNRTSTLKMKTAGPTKTLVTFYQTTQHHIPEGSKRHNHFGIWKPSTWKHHMNFRLIETWLNISHQPIFANIYTKLKFTCSHKQQSQSGQVSHFVEWFYKGTDTLLHNKPR